MYSIKNQRGGITVFQCIILTALLLFFGALIDIARIMLAEKEVQSAVNTAARSVLAGYDKDLAGDYGLFALNTVSDGSSVKDEFIKYLSANLQSGRSGFSLIKYEIDASKTSASGYRNILSNEDNVFKEQILKYMKYRTPLNTTRNVVDKLVSSGIFKKKEFAEKEKKVREQRQEIKLNINRLNNNIKSVNSTIGEVSNYPINDSNGREYLNKLKALKIGFIQSDSVIGTAIQGLEAYSKVSDDSNAFAELANKDETLKGEAEIKVYKREFDNANEALNKAKSDMERGMQGIELHINLMEPLQNEIENISNAIDALEKANSNLKKENEKNKEDKDNTKNSEEVLEENHRKISELQAQLQTIMEQMNNIKSSFKVENIEEIELAEAENKPVEAPKKDKNESSSKLTELQKDLDKLLGNRRLDNSWLINEQEYHRTQLEDNNKYEELSNREVPLSEGDIEKAENDNASIFAFIDRVKLAMENSTKNLYVVEYIMDRFTYHATATERDHYFQKGEIEYILWGGSSQNGNIASTITAIGFLRFAVNTIDYFATSKVPHPVFRLVYAVGKGMLQSFVDCYHLYKGESIWICPTLNKSAFKLNYADHLRVFLLIQATADEKGQLNNIRQLIQVNTKKPEVDSNLQRPDFELSNYNAVLDAKATVRVNLWFLPLLQLDKLGTRYFDGGKYVFSKEIHLGY